jgi:hypothetical protein
LVGDKVSTFSQKADDVVNGHMIPLSGKIGLSQPNGAYIVHLCDKLVEVKYRVYYREDNWGIVHRKECLGCGHKFSGKDSFLLDLVNFGI